MNNMKSFQTLIIFLLVTCMNAAAQQVISLYPSGHDASLTVFTPASGTASRTAVMVIPGGAYAFLAIEEEGMAIGKAFAEKGITAFVLTYRLPAAAMGDERSRVSLADAQRGLQCIRARAQQYNLDTGRVGVIGFSAGGHLAAMLATHSDTSFLSPATKGNLRPDFAVLVYPVITMDTALTHMGSRINLIGEHPSAEQIAFYSAEKNITARTPPTYITHTGDDGIVSVDNSIVMYEALRAKNVDAELHLYPRGDHGFIQRLPVDEWLSPILLFLRKEKMLPETK
jgi:acetyl esterase/lipase